MPKKDVKGQALAEFLVDCSIIDDWVLNDDLPDAKVLVIDTLQP